MGPMWKTNDCWAAKTKTPSNMVRKELKDGKSWPPHQGSKSENEQGTETPKGIS